MSMTSTEWFDRLWTTELRQEYDHLTGPQPWRTDDEYLRQKSRLEIIGASFDQNWPMDLDSIMEKLRKQDEEKKIAYEVRQGQSQAHAIEQTEAPWTENREKAKEGGQSLSCTNYIEQGIPCTVRRGIDACSNCKQARRVDHAIDKIPSKKKTTKKGATTERKKAANSKGKRKQLLSTEDGCTDTDMISEPTMTLTEQPTLPPAPHPTPEPAPQHTPEPALQLESDEIVPYRPMNRPKPEVILANMREMRDILMRLKHLYIQQMDVTTAMYDYLRENAGFSPSPKRFRVNDGIEALGLYIRVYKEGW